MKFFGSKKNVQNFTNIVNITNGYHLPRSNKEEREM
jgi:hypothetical protein